MRQIPAALAASIEGGAAGLCHAWVVALHDGTRLGFTDHDGPLSVDGVTCSAASGWTAGAAEGALGVVGSASAAGVLDDVAVRDGDLEDGRWDGAIVDLWRVDWRTPQTRVRLWRGTIARIVRVAGTFTAEVEGPLAKLDRVVGRTYAKACDARLGDARCGIVPPAGAVCDQRWRTCRETFGNALNFRGFPGIPGDDFLTVYPVEGGRHDGGAR